MEPISASLANSAAINTDPFEDAATTFVFGSSDTADQAASLAATQTPESTAANAQGQGARASAATSGAAASSGGLNLSSLLIYAVIGLVAYHFFVK